MTCPAVVCFMTVTGRFCLRLNLDGGWAETGDRYMLKLFRDYVFHAVTEEGRPFLDMAHVVQCLNKLDAGSSDKVRVCAGLLGVGRGRTEAEQ